jgi:hypothetical protein
VSIYKSIALHKRFASVGFATSIRNPRKRFKEALRPQLIPFLLTNNSNTTFSSSLLFLASLASTISRPVPELSEEQSEPDTPSLA